MLRAGSTLQYQIASELIERSGLGVRSPYADPMSHEGALQAAVPKGISRTFKSHALTPSIMERLADGNAVALYSFRDLRDVIASQQQKNGWSLGERDLRALVADLLATDSAWRSLPRVHVVRYESMVTRLLEEVLDSAAFLEVPCALSLAESIAADLSYEAQLRRLASITGESWVHVDPNNVYDVNSLLHRNHLQSGRPGRFCEVLAPVQVAIIELVAGDWLANNGYGASG
jgi:hypothetical protein